MHQSTAINYAVLYNKPIVFITSKTINENLIEDPSPDWLAKYFGTAPVYIDEHYDLDWSPCLKTNESAYRRYRNDFIKREDTFERPRWQIVADCIKAWGHPIDR